MSKADTQEQILEMLQSAYNMEIETVINYLANAVWLDGMRANHIKNSLTAEVDGELGHAKLLANRIKVLEGRIPGSLAMRWGQKMLQPPVKPTDVKAVIMGVISAEQQAIDHYMALINLCDKIDPVTQELCVKLMGDEEGHRRLFKGFLAEADTM